MNGSAVTAITAGSESIANRRSELSTTSNAMNIGVAYQVVSLRKKNDVPCSFGSTGIGGGIAIPHGRMSSLTEPRGLFARLAHPIDFDSIDERPVDIVFSHANGFNARTYRSILAPLAAEMRILALDARGHGASTLPTVIEGRAGWHEFRDDLLALLLPAYVKEGKSYLTIAVGCTGGRHRSVVLAEELAIRMARLGFPPSVSHRDVGR